jgi:hypothetical protein
VKLFTSRFACAKGLLLILLILLFGSCNTEIKEMTIRVRSRVYVNYSEEHKVKMYEKFQISDTDLEAVVVEFYPDFTIDTLTLKAVSRSDTLYNPAAKILIIRGKDKKEETWAFAPGMIPHYSPRSFIGFELVDYKTSGKYIKPSHPINDETHDDK